MRKHDKRAGYAAIISPIVKAFTITAMEGGFIGRRFKVQFLAVALKYGHYLKGLKLIP